MQLKTRRTISSSSSHAYTFKTSKYQTKLRSFFIRTKLDIDAKSFLVIKSIKVEGISPF